MIFVENTIENKIIGLLSNGSLSSPELVSKISKEIGVTPQGVYKAIGFLIDNEILNKNKKMLSLNNIWVEKIRSFSDEVSENYSLKDFDDYLLLENKEKITYTFKNAIRLDNQWLHFVLVIAKRFSENPIFIWNPHHWFIFGRNESETILFDWFNKQNKDVFLTIGGNYDLDKIAKDKIKSENVRVNLNTDQLFSEKDYITVIGDYILTTRYSDEFNKEVFNIFKNKSIDSENIIEDLKAIAIKPQKSKIILERNRIKAKRYSKKMSKDFYIDERVRGLLK